MTKITVNRAPVLTLWGTVVAERLGYSRATALTLGKTIAGKTAFSKGQTIGRVQRREPAPPPKAKSSAEKTKFIAFMGRHATLVETAAGPLALADGVPIAPKDVEKYLDEKFSEHLAEARSAMETLATSRSPAQLAREAFGLYAKFRPAVPAGSAGWGKEGVLDTDVVLKMAEAKKRLG
jgi:hypothetical protein